MPQHSELIQSHAWGTTHFYCILDSIRTESLDLSQFLLGSSQFVFGSVSAFYSLLLFSVILCVKITTFQAL